MFSLTILFLLTGSLMCQTSKSRTDETPGFLLLTFGEQKFGIMKFSCQSGAPRSDYWGKQIQRKKNDIGLYLVFSPDDKVMKVEYSDRESLRVLPELRLIFRMPDSPLHTFVYVDAKFPGSLAIWCKNVSSPYHVDLANHMDKIRFLSLSLTNDKEKSIDFSMIPEILFGNSP
jgi:hypothetical protein